MRKFILALVLLSVLVNAGIEQSYEQTVKRDGNSVIVKTMDINIAAAELGPNAFQYLAETCNASGRFVCSVEDKKITMEETFSPGTYYTFKTEYGLFSIDHMLVVSKIPTDRFSMTLDDLLDEADIIESSGDAAELIDLNDAEINREAAGYLRRFNANMTYTIVMPGDLKEAYAGNVTAARAGNAAVYDLISVMEESQPMVVKSSELNTANMIIVGAVIVLGALAYSFFREKPKPAKKKKK